MLMREMEPELIITYTVVTRCVQVQMEFWSSFPIPAPLQVSILFYPSLQFPTAVEKDVHITSGQTIKNLPYSVLYCSRNKPIKSLQETLAKACSRHGVIICGYTKKALLRSWVLVV